MSGPPAADADNLASLLAEYYGVSLDESSAPAPQVAASSTSASSSETDSGTRKSSNNAKRGPRPETYDLNSPHFDLDTYFSVEIKSRRLGELEDFRTKVSEEVRSFDTDMQKLVFRNYNNFIMATNAIRALNTDVSRMQTEMNRLFIEMDGISRTSGDIEQKLAPTRSKIEQLVSIRRLLKKVEFLFELPSRLNKSIQLGAYAQAVKYFQLANKILHNLRHIKSFQNIQHESESIMASLKQTLRESVCDSSLSSIAQLEHASLLLQVGESAGALWEKILDARRTRLQHELARAAQLASETAAPSNQAVDDYGGRSKLLAYLHQYFLLDFFDFMEQFMSLFCNLNVVNENQQKAIQAGLVKFVRGLFNEYFTHVSQALHQAAETAAMQLTSDPFGPFVEDLIFFFTNIKRASGLVAGTRLLDKSHEIVEKALRHCIRVIFESAQKKITLVLRNLHDKSIELVRATQIENQTASTGITSLFTPPPAANPNPMASMFTPPSSSSSSSGGPSSPELSGMAGPNSPNPIDEKKVEPEDVAVEKLRAELSSGPGNQIIMLLMDAIQCLMPLLTSRSVAEIIDTPFSSVVYDHLRQTFTNMTQLLLQDTIRLAEAHVHAVNENPSLHWSEISGNSATPALYYLVLSQLCGYMEQKGITIALQCLQDSFPPMHIQGQRRASYYMEDTSSIAHEMKETAQLLLTKYVDTHGVVLSTLLIQEMQRYDWRTNINPKFIRPVILHFYRDMKQVELELKKIFPRLIENKSAPSTTRAPSRINQRMDYERFFSKKIQILAGIKANRASPLVGVYKVAFKALLEVTRSMHFSREGLHQLQVDVYALMAQLPLSIPQDDHHILHALLDDVLVSGNDRCMFPDSLDPNIQTKIRIQQHGVFYDV